jgi:hypothetical protein
MAKPKVPDNCPGCGKALCTHHLLRPAPKMQLKAWIVLLSGCVMGAVLFLGVVWYLRFEIGIPTYLSTLISFPIALPSAFIMGWLAYRFPRVIRLRCRACCWSDVRYDSSR